MRAVTVREPGGEPRVHTLADPEPPAGQVVVDMLYAGVNPIDVWIARGELGDAVPFPHIPGCEGVGTVDGTRVALIAPGVGRSRPGTYAERVVVGAGEVVPLPARVDPVQAAGAKTAGLTAMEVLKTGGLTSDDVVLVLGASGGVGSFAVQLAKNAGARVLAHTTGTAKAEALGGLGADRVVTASAPDSLAAAVGDDRPSLVLDGLAGGWTQAAMEAAAEEGRIAVFGTSADRRLTLDARTLYGKRLRVQGGNRTKPATAVLREELAGLLSLIADARVRVPVGTPLPLGRTAEAHAAILARTALGKIILSVRD
ncbi:quinone oxidoreductase family protein [Actinoallomurus iriomotensis]|uniref:Alcohol dehydrogenase n=1 Tax=Actinoallomurus iriomotensis TaxID=478107 RepID=A0A9W6VNV7_9ACTN|nr:zinc-binding alcohol dehydrogenase family protein [Actinoallomurus iriomotensis]GLY79223.1 alcohol dehydrogenase [Actinoallomurus iriomotensis]